MLIALSRVMVVGPSWDDFDYESVAATEAFGRPEMRDSFDTGEVNDHSGWGIL
jgi:hypothetical protein